MSDKEAIEEEVQPFDFRAKPGQEVVIQTADNRLSLTIKAILVEATRSGIYVLFGGKMRYYPKNQLTFYEWTPRFESYCQIIRQFNKPEV